MRKYEAMFIVKPDLTSDDQAKVVDLIEKTITKNKGKITIAEKWGKRRLAYEIAGYGEGDYHRFEFEIDPGYVSDLKRSYRLSEDIIRELIIVKE